MFKTAKTALVALALTAAPAAAMTVTFDLTGSDAKTYSALSGSSLTLTDAASGLSVTIDAKQFRRYYRDGGSWIGTSNVGSGTVVDDALLGQYSTGAGIMSNGTWDGWRADGYGTKEFFQMSFSQDVRLNAVRLGHYNTEKTNFRIFEDTNGSGDIGIGDQRSARYEMKSDGTSWVNLAGNHAEASIFALAGFEIDDFFALREISVDFGALSQPTSAPLPAGGVLLLTAIAGLGWARKRKA
jgi:hypothetical protein